MVFLTSLVAGEISGFWLLVSTGNAYVAIAVSATDMFVAF